MWEGERLVIPRKTARAIVRTAEQFKGVEVCGVLLGWGTVGQMWWPIPNIHSEPERFYQMDPDCQIRAWEWASKRQMRVVAVVHSHPTRDATLSSADIDYAAFGPEMFYAVLGMNPLELRAWVIERDGEEVKVRPHEVMIDPSKPGFNYCHTHNRYEDDFTCYRICFECGHVFATELDLIAACNDNIAEMVATAEYEEMKRDLNANRIDSGSQAGCCPYCGHGW